MYAKNSKIKKRRFSDSLPPPRGEHEALKLQTRWHTSLVYPNNIQNAASLDSSELNMLDDWHMNGLLLYKSIQTKQNW